jgi:hypothetical protein
MDRGQPARLGAGRTTYKIPIARKNPQGDWTPDVVLLDDADILVPWNEFEQYHMEWRREREKRLDALEKMHSYWETRIQALQKTLPSIYSVKPVNKRRDILSELAAARKDLSRIDDHSIPHEPKVVVSRVFSIQELEKMVGYDTPPAPKVTIEPLKY